MPLTLAQARVQLQNHLDDDGTRWSTTGSAGATEVDLALAWARDVCLREYIGSGGHRFDITEELTSSSSGLIDLSTHDPIAVRGLTMKVGTRHFPLSEVKPEQRNINDDTARTFVVRYAKPYTGPTDTTHPLVGTGATAAPTWDSFDHWVIAKAAVFLAVKDGEPRPELSALESMARDAVLLTPVIPKAVRFPGATVWYGTWFAYHYRPDLKKIQIVKRT